MSAILSRRRKTQQNALQGAAASSRKEAPAAVSAAVTSRPLVPLSLGDLSGAEEEDERLHEREATSNPVASVARQRQSAMFGDLSGAEEEDESLHEDLRVTGRGKRALPDNEKENADAMVKNVSRMSTSSLDKMVRLLESMANDAADKASDHLKTLAS